MALLLWRLISGHGSKGFEVTETGTSREAVLTNEGSDNTEGGRSRRGGDKGPVKISGIVCPGIISNEVGKVEFKGEVKTTAGSTMPGGDCSDDVTSGRRMGEGKYSSDNSKRPIPIMT